MISKSRMQLDVLGQGIIIIALSLLLFFASGFMWTKITFVLIIFWQIASACHLFLAYKYIQRKNFLRYFLVLLISLPLWLKLIGSFAYLPVAGVVLWYFYRSIRDMIIVNNRPRSFWDLS